MAFKKAAQDNTEIEVKIDVKMGSLIFYLLGTTALMMNRMPEKARQQLLLPPLRRNRTELETTLKHDPMAEFRSSVYRYRGDDQPTRLLMPAEAFKRSIATACLRTPGATKTEIGQLVKVPGINISIYGIPQIDMRPVRMAGITRAPDIRTRAYLPEWCCEVEVQWVQPLLRHGTIERLFGNAGIFIGVGDGRPEKGALDFGTFKLVSEDDKQWKHIAKIGGRKAQDAAMLNPEFSNEDTRDLFSWYESEVKLRAAVPPDAFKGKRRKKNGDDSEYEMMERAALAIEARFGEDGIETVGE